MRVLISVAKNPITMLAGSIFDVTIVPCPFSKSIMFTVKLLYNPTNYIAFIKQSGQPHN